MPAYVTLSRRTKDKTLYVGQEDSMISSWIQEWVNNMESINYVLEEITKRLVKEFNPESIFLFGSHVWGNPDNDSDLDLLVIVNQSGLSPSKRASLAYRCLRDISYPLDILVKTRKEIERFSSVPAALECQILQKGKLLYG